MATATNYDPAMTVRSARARYFADNEFGDDGGYNDRWVVLAKLGPIPLGIPNTAGRARLVPYHDIHHLVTGYGTDFAGEGEISTWELATGCTQQPTAWVLNTMALPLGLRHIKRLERAFARGCRTRNLYSEPFNDDLLDQRLGDVRERLGFVDGEEVEMTAAQRRRFWRMVALGVGLHLLALSVVLGVLAGIVVGVMRLV